MKTVNYSLRMDPLIKSEAEATFSAFGLNLSDAITVFLHTAIKKRGFPFPLVNEEYTPSQSTLDLIERIETGEEVLDGPYTYEAYKAHMQAYLSENEDAHV